MSSFVTSPPSAEFICKTLKTTYEARWADVNKFVKDMVALKIEDDDPTYNDTYTVEYEIDKKVEHIAQWFDYYCRGEARDEPFEDLELKNQFDVKGAGPNGKCPGFETH